MSVAKLLHFDKDLKYIASLTPRDWSILYSFTGVYHKYFRVDYLNLAMQERESIFNGDAIDSQRSIIFDLCVKWEQKTLDKKTVNEIKKIIRRSYK